MSQQEVVEMLSDIIECYLMNYKIPTKVTHGTIGRGYARIFFRHAIIPPSNMIGALRFTTKCRTIEAKSGMIKLSWG